MLIRFIYNRILYIPVLMDSNWENGEHWMRKFTFLLLILLMFPTFAEGAPQKFNFTVQTNTALNFENGSYIIDVIEIYKPMYVKVNLTSGGVSRISTLFDGEAPITFNEIKLTSSSITGTTAIILIEFPAGWSLPKQYQVVRPVLAPNIVLTKSVDKTNINDGDVVSFTIKVENTGNTTAYNLTLIDSFPRGFSTALGKFPPVIADKLEAGESQELYYALKAVDSGTFGIEPAIVKYGLKTSKSNSLTITVAATTLEKSNLTTVISLDKKNVHTDDLIKATIKITNTGKASAKSVLVEGTPPIGMEVIEGDLRQVYDSISPMESKEYRVGLKPTETGNYSIHLRTTYNDDAIGMPSDSDPITVTQKEQNYIYVLVPIIIIIAGIVLFTIRRHREYSY